MRERNRVILYFRRANDSESDIFLAGFIVEIISGGAGHVFGIAGETAAADYFSAVRRVFGADWIFAVETQEAFVIPVVTPFP